MRTHVSLNGVLYKTGPAVRGYRVDGTYCGYGATLIGYGRHVNPTGNYDGAPTVTLYQGADGYFCI